jgi:protein-S-isoprenylcysteine O-methyltransferase Ste14
MWVKLIIFIIASAGLVYVSRASLRAPRSHGFYRFFAWEGLVVLVLLNIECWFCNPLSLPQLISWLLLIVSLVPVIYGTYLLRRLGQPDNQRTDAPLFEFEKTTTLVTAGLYKYIRHPLYSSLLFLGWGVFFKDVSWLGGGLALVITLFLVLTAKAEESENVRFFGAAYQDYIKQTRMFVPFVF